MAACPGGFAELELCFGGRIDRAGEVKRERRKGKGVDVVMKFGVGLLRGEINY